MATSDKILEAGRRKEAGEELKGEAYALANLVDSPANPELPQDIQDRWAQMSLEDRSVALGSLIDQKTGNGTAPQQTAPERNTEAPVAIPEDEETQEYSANEWGLGRESVQDGWITPAFTPGEARLRKKSRAENNVWAASIKSLNEGSSFPEALVEIESTKGNIDSQGNMKQESEKFQQAEARTTRRQVEDNLKQPNLDPEDSLNELEALRIIEKDRLNRAGSVFKTLVEATGVESDAPEIADEIVGSLAMYQVYRDASDKVSGGDVFWDVTRSFIPGVATKDALTASGQFDATGYLVEVKNGIDNLPPEERASALRALEMSPEMQALPDAKRARVIGALAGPIASESLADEFNSLDIGLDLVDIALTVSGIGIAAAAAYRGLRTVKNLKSADEAAEAVAVAAISDSERARDAVVMDKDNLANTLDPFASTWLDPDSLDGLSDRSLKKIQQFDEQARERGNELAQGLSYNREGFLTDREAEVARKNIEHKVSQIDGVDDVEAIRAGDNIVVTYTKRDAGGEAVPEREVFELTLDEDTQEMFFKDPGVVRRHMAAKGVWATDDFREVVRSAERLDSSEAKVLSELRGLWQEALEPVLGKGVSGFAKTFSPKQRKRVQALDDVLLSGDAEQRMYTANELKAGVLGYKFDDEMVESYFHIRSTIDNLYYLRNSEKRRELQLKKMKNLDVQINDETVQAIGRPLSDPQAASQSINSNSPRYFFDEASGEMREIGLLDLDAVYMEGKVLTRLNEPTSFGGFETEVRYALIDKESVTELPWEVIPYREGYVPKLNENVGHVVKIATPRDIDGNVHNAFSDNANLQAVRFFDSKKEADIWADAENARLQSEGVSPEVQRYVRHEDKQLEKERRVTALSGDSAGFGGGLYTGARSNREILFGPGQGTKPIRVNSFEAISRAITATSRYVSRNEWRLGLQERILKTANMLLEGTDASPLSGKFTAFDQLGAVEATTENNRKIKAMYEATRDWLNYPSTEELLFKNYIQSVLDNSGVVTKLPGAKKGLHSLKSKDPVGAARAAAFHGLLGFWNPVQVWVQAQGAAAALSMNILRPDRMVGTLRDQFALQVLQHIDINHLPHVAKSTGMKLEDLKEMKTVWDKTGLEAAVLTTADHSASAAGYGITTGAFRRAADAGLFFYRGGELFTRRTAFATAFREWKQANKGATVTDEGLRAILDRSNNLMLNMGKAQRASWQKGILGVATQFQQVNMRIIETLLGANGNFSLGERGKIMAGQLALYGSAGVPLANMGAQYYMELTGIKNIADLEKEVGPGAVKAMNEGFLGWATLQALGVDLEIGDRSAYLGGIRRFVSDLMFTEGSTAEKLTGAFGNTGARFWTTLLGKYEPLSLGLAQNRPIDPVLSATAPIWASISTFRNVDKALAMHHFNRIIDKNFGTVISRDFSLKEEVYTAAGFRLTDETAIWQREKRVEVQKQLEKNLINDIVRETNKFALAATQGNLTEEDIREFKNNRALTIQLAGTQGAQLRVMEGVQRKLANLESKENQSWKEYRMYADDELTNILQDWNRAIHAPGAFAQGVLEGGYTHRQGVYDEEGEEQ